MKKFILNSCNITVNSRYNPLRHLDMGSQYDSTKVLAWTCGTMLSLSFLSIFQFHIAWLAYPLMTAGIFISLIAFQRAQESLIEKVPVTNLSRGSACVWKMDREA